MTRRTRNLSAMLVCAAWLVPTHARAATEVKVEGVAREAVLVLVSTWYRGLPGPAIALIAHDGPMRTNDGAPDPASRLQLLSCGTRCTAVEIPATFERNEEGTAT